MVLVLLNHSASGSSAGSPSGRSVGLCLRTFLATYGQCWVTTPRTTAFQMSFRRFRQRRTLSRMTADGEVRSAYFERSASNTSSYCRRSKVKDSLWNRSISAPSNGSGCCHPSFCQVTDSGVRSISTLTAPHHKSPSIGHKYKATRPSLKSPDLRPRSWSNCSIAALGGRSSRREVAPNSSGANSSGTTIRSRSDRSFTTTS